MLPSLHHQNEGNCGVHWRSATSWDHRTAFQFQQPHSHYGTEGHSSLCAEPRLFFAACRFMGLLLLHEKGLVMMRNDKNPGYTLIHEKHLRVLQNDFLNIKIRDSNLYQQLPSDWSLPTDRVFYAASRLAKKKADLEVCPELAHIFCRPSNSYGIFSMLDMTLKNHEDSGSIKRRPIYC